MGRWLGLCISGRGESGSAISAPEFRGVPMSGGENCRTAEGISPRPTVLLVDDEPLIQWSLGEAIREAGYPVQLAGSAADTRRVLVRLVPGPLVVILDLRLPDVVDLSLLQMLRLRRPDAPVLVLSAWASADT